MNFLTIPLAYGSNDSKTPNKPTRTFTLPSMTSFKNDLSALTRNDVISLNDVDTSFDTFWDNFSTLYDLHFPLKNQNFNKNTCRINKFMTAGLLISKTHKYDLHKKSIIEPQLYLERYRNYRNLYNTLVRLSKKLYYDSKFVQYSNNPKKIWSLLNDLTGNKKSSTNRVIPHVVADGKNISSPPEIANTFNSFFVKAGQNISDSVPPSTRSPESFFNPTENPPPPDLEFGNINSWHVSDIIKSFPNKQSLDIDGISLKLLKFVRNEVCIPLAHIFNLSFESGIFPSKLKINRTVPIFKNEDPSLCDNYRPISLIPTLSKIIEKIAAVTLTNHLQLNKLLHINQFGFQRNTSTEHNLLKVFNYIGDSLNKGNYCIGVFLDLRKAFDSCSHDILLKKLNKLGIKNIPLD